MSERSLTDDIAAACDAALGSWPALASHRAAFEEALRRRCTAASGLTPSRLHAADLLLALACAVGDPIALAAFDERVLAAVPALVRGAKPEEAAEIRQQLASRLLVPQDGEGPGIIAYEGRGPLLTWVRVAATRLFRNLRRDSETATRYEAAGAPVPLPVIDPELAAVRARFGADFRAAFREAFEALDGPERTILRLHYLDGLTVERLGRVLGAPRATAGRRLVEARGALVDETLRRLSERMRVDDAELRSLLAVVRSKLEVSLTILLREPAA